MKEEALYLDPSFKERGQKIKLSQLKTRVKLLSSYDEAEES